MSVMFSCRKVIETPHQSSKAIVDTSNGCLRCPKLAIGGKLCGIQHTNPLICDMYISINSLRMLLHLTYQSLNNTLRASELWWHVLIIICRTFHGEEHKTKKKTSEEEQKGLALLGCSCYKALTLNLLTRALASSNLAPRDGEGNQQVSNLKEDVSVMARESL
jgi:Fe-S-cluster containining protein